MNEDRDTSKPLTSAEAKRLAAETQNAMDAAVTAGNADRYHSLKIDAEFYAAALEAARSREAIEQQAQHDQDLDALKPEAREWLAKARAETALSSQLDKIERGLMQIFEAAAELPGVIEALEFARARARELAPKAGLACPPTMPVNANLLRRLVLARAQAAYVAVGFPAMPQRERKRLQDLFPNFPIGSALAEGYTSLLARQQSGATA